MDNFERGDRALHAMRAYAEVGGFSSAEGLRGETTFMGVQNAFIPGYPIGDLIADLCHLMMRLEVRPMDTIAGGIAHWGADIVEQAWEYSDDWDPKLQAARNEARALHMLRLNGVPEVYHERVLVLLGIVGRDDPRHPTNRKD